MSGPDLQDSCVIIAVTGSGLCLSYFLFGLKAATTLAGITVVGIVLKHTLSPKRPTRSRRGLQKRASLRTKSRSAESTAQSNKENIPPPVCVTPDGWVSKRRNLKKRSTYLEDIPRLPTFDGDFSL